MVKCDVTVSIHMQVILSYIHVHAQAHDKLAMAIMLAAALYKGLKHKKERRKTIALLPSHEKYHLLINVKPGFL